MTKYGIQRLDLGPRARSISIKRLGAKGLKLASAFYPAPHYRPTKRSECVDMERPCPYVSCRYHLYLDVNPRTGSIKLNFPDREPHQLAESCALDVADDGGHTLEEVGVLMNVTRERMRQLEHAALVQIRLSRDAAAVEMRRDADGQ